MIPAEKMSSVFAIKPITDENFEILRSIVYRETGIRLTDLKKSLLQSRLLRRLRALGLVSYSEYTDYIRDNYDSEIMDFINAVTTNKTEFFRENQHFVFMKEVALPELEKKERKHIRIWSAGCSTGEEPYSIAIILNEYFQSNIPDVKILATDIDTQVLEKGLQGIYTQEQLADMDRSYKIQYFEPVLIDGKQKFRVKDKLKDLIVFKRLNFLDEAYPMKGKFEIIFCRNVVIYFDKPTQKKLFQRFYHYLSDDGYLCVGHSENLSGISESFQHIGRTVYRKVPLEAK
jgi:chemotaxis protein methyltransferase CheR